MINPGEYKLTMGGLSIGVKEKEAEFCSLQLDGHEYLRTGGKGGAAFSGKEKAVHRRLFY